ncbi:hypothetical protein Q5P01_002275 [Channa striata]|uniref:Uncharacterized protein n=1 Tax=Channa striata TaxID=64152 RepID=A0AA88T4N8_CHASR|nr:hypothetical protein Q5P01_002275 [Channa striata]
MLLKVLLELFHCNLLQFCPSTSNMYHLTGDIVEIVKDQGGFKCSYPFLGACERALFVPHCNQGLLDFWETWWRPKSVLKWSVVMANPRSHGLHCPVATSPASVVLSIAAVMEVKIVSFYQRAFYRITGHGPHVNLACAFTLDYAFHFICTALALFLAFQPSAPPLTHQAPWCHYER